MIAHRSVGVPPAPISSGFPVATGGGAASSVGLWIRVAANLRDRKVTWRLVEMMRVSHPAVVSLGAALPNDLLRTSAEGLLLNLWGKIAEHTTDGVITEIPPAQLEDWAGWGGTPGAFAAWVMAAHFDREKGTVREWEECAGALQSKRANDAERQRRRRERERDRLAREAAEEAARAAGGASAGSGTNPVESINRAALALQLVVAANRGMADNDALGGAAMPIHANRGDSLEIVDHFLASGIGPDDFAILSRLVYTVAKKYMPAKRGDQIRSLNYFRDSVLDLWHRHKAAEAERLAPAIADVDTVPLTGARRSTDQRARTQRAAAGAFVAGEAVGLADDEHDEHDDEERRQ
jgi:hypothetical protein